MLQTIPLIPVCAGIVEHIDNHALKLKKTMNIFFFILKCSGTGEHIDNLEMFEEKAFISKLLGMGDIQVFFANILISQKVLWPIN